MYDLVTADESTIKQSTQSEKPKPIKAIAFDMDGVLFNSGAHTAIINGEEIDLPELHRYVFNKALKAYGLPTISDDEAPNYIGKTSKTKLGILADKDGVPVPKELYDDISKLKTKLTLEELPKYASPNEEHLEALATLKAEGYKLVLTSNSDPETLKLVMSKTGLDQYFDYMLSNKDVKNPKPAPDIYNMAGEKVGISQDQLMFIEDTDVGTTAGLKANIPVGMKVEGPDDVNIENIHDFIEEAEEFKLEKWEDQQNREPQQDSNYSAPPLMNGRHIDAAEMQNDTDIPHATGLHKVLELVHDKALLNGYDPELAVSNARNIDAYIQNAQNKGAEL